MALQLPPPKKPREPRCSLCRRPRRGKLRCIGPLLPVGKGKVCNGCAAEAAKVFAQLVRHVRMERRLPKLYPQIVKKVAHVDPVT